MRSGRRAPLRIQTRTFGIVVALGAMGGYGPMRSWEAVLAPMCIPAVVQSPRNHMSPYAMPGTDLADGAISEPSCLVLTYSRGGWRYQ
eukprot:623128-Rhodomonas_salina.3